MARPSSTVVTLRRAPLLDCPRSIPADTSDSLVIRAADLSVGLQVGQDRNGDGDFSEAVTDISRTRPQACTGSPQPYKLTLTMSSGSFEPGPAQAVVQGVTYQDHQPFDSFYIEEGNNVTVVLRGL